MYHVSCIEMSSKLDHYKNIGRIVRQSATLLGGWRMAGCETVQRLTPLIRPHPPLFLLITPTCRRHFQCRWKSQSLWPIDRWRIFYKINCK